MPPFKPPYRKSFFAEAALAGSKNYRVYKTVVLLTLEKWALKARFLAEICKLTDLQIKVS